MKSLFILLFTFTHIFAAESLSDQIDYFQDLFNNPAKNTTISNSSYNVGETRPKALLKGVFYFGGTDRSRKLLSSNFRKKICRDGFSRIYSVYRSVNTTVSCSEGDVPYTKVGEASINSSSGDRVYKLLKNVYDIIQSDGAIGAMYVHCHYGVHASNTIAQMVLKQFCGISNEKAYENWDKIDLYDSLGAAGRKKQFKKIRNFHPYEEFSISDTLKEKICY